jgi:RNase H-fold protein (predicted Holliday junction resolvase)
MKIYIPYGVSGNDRRRYEKKDRRDKATVDKISAVIILQEFLQNNKL